MAKTPFGDTPFEQGDYVEYEGLPATVEKPGFINSIIRFIFGDLKPEDDSDGYYWAQNDLLEKKDW